MAQCFVIQPFDAGKFDKRYLDVFVPAIKEAKLEPYRVDKDPSVNDLLESIKAGIADSVAFLADITTDNPNVWYELGHSMSLELPYCICCSEERTTSFPFDVGHLSIIKYKVGSSSDFTELGAKITERLKAVVTHDVRLRSIARSASSLTETHGLAPNEMVALTVLFEYQYDEEPGLTASSLKSDMQKAGFTRVATNLALSDLLQRGYVERNQNRDHNGEPFSLYCLTDQGTRWLSQNRDRLVLTHSTRKSGPISDEDIPF